MSTELAIPSKSLFLVSTFGGFWVRDIDQLDAMKCVYLACCIKTKARDSVSAGILGLELGLSVHEVKMN
jgi:hypothetical protein